MLSLLSLSLSSHTALSVILPPKLQASQTFGQLARKVFPFRLPGLAEACGENGQKSICSILETPPWSAQATTDGCHCTSQCLSVHQTTGTTSSLLISSLCTPARLFVSPEDSRLSRVILLSPWLLLQKTPKRLKKGCTRVTLSQWHGVDENNNKQKDRRRDDMRNDTALHFASALSILSALMSSAFLLSFSNAVYLEFSPTQLNPVVLPSRWRYSITACQMWWNKTFILKMSEHEIEYIWARKKNKQGSQRGTSSGGINTQSHYGFCSNPEAFTGERRAQRLLLKLWGWKSRLVWLNKLTVSLPTCVQFEEKITFNAKRLN